jgi:DNA-binding phage protein
VEVIKMNKTKTLKRRKISSLSMSNKEINLRIKKDAKVSKFNPDRYLSKEFIGSAIMECLLNNDPEGIIELLEIYLDEHNKVALLKEAKVARSTVYQALKHKNPTIKTLAKIVSTVSQPHVKNNRHSSK